VPGLDYYYQYSPVVNDVTFRIFLTCVLVWGLQTLVFDIETAFLHGSFQKDEQVFMNCPLGMVHHEDECLLLLKTLYGLIQAARHYFNFFCKILISIGFKQSKADPCLFIFKNALGIMIIIVYVDDCALGYSCQAVVTFLFQELTKKNINFTVEKNMSDYLSCEILFNKTRTQAWLGQPHLIKKLKNLFADKVSHLQKYNTPGTPNQGIRRPKEGDAILDNEMATSYRSGVGMLLYLVKHSRIDLGNPVRELTKVLKSPTVAAYKEMLRVIKFVLDTATMGLKLVPHTVGGQLEWRLVGYSDSDWANDLDNRKSVMAFILFLCGIPIMWRSKQASIVAQSSTEAEYISLSELAKEILFVVQILTSLGISVKTPITVRVDNMGAIFLAENANSSSRTRHISVRHHFLNDLCSSEPKFLDVIFVCSEENTSDILSKNANGAIYHKHAPSLLFDKSSLD
jgi:Reverse transcriptase (RNA-dependent DNA polymerase)